MQRLYRVLLLSAALQLCIAWLPDTMGDLFVYRSWTRSLAEHGIMTAYWPSSSTAEDSFLRPPIDYPPVLPYVLLCLGRGLGVLDPALLHARDRLLDFAIRVPFVLANLAIALMVYAVLRRRAAPRTALWAAALFAFNPAVVFDTAYWGQADSLCVVFVVAGLILLERGRSGWAWALIVVAALVKPLAWPFVPLVALASLKRFGLARTLRASVAAAAVALASLLPFLLEGRFVAILKTLFLQIDAMPYTSVNAHNFWWIASGGHPWTPAAQQWLGGPSYETVGLLLFGAVYLLCARELWISGDSRALFRASAGAAFGFFMLATHMHENHLFAFLPLLLLARGDEPAWRRFFVLCSLTFLMNMLLHDPFLMHVAGRFAVGPRLRVPPQLDPAPGLADHFIRSGYPHLAEEMKGDHSLAWFLLTLLNSQANVLLFVYWLARGLEGRAGVQRAIPRWAAPATVALVLAIGLPFVRRVLWLAEGPR